MSLISYENLPSFMKNKKVKKYYDILKKKRDTFYSFRIELQNTERNFLYTSLEQ